MWWIERWKRANVYVIEYVFDVIGVCDVVSGLVLEVASVNEASISAAGECLGRGDFPESVAMLSQAMGYNTSVCSVRCAMSCINVLRLHG